VSGTSSDSKEEHCAEYKARGHKVDHISEETNSPHGASMQPGPERGNEPRSNLAHIGRRVLSFGLDRHDTPSKRDSKVETEKLKRNAQTREGENLVAQPQPQERQPVSDSKVTGNEDLSHKLRKCLEELQKAKEDCSKQTQKLQQREGELKLAKDEINKLNQKKFHLLVEKKAPENHSEAEKVYEDITTQLKQLTDTDDSRFKESILKLKFKRAEMLIYQERHLEAEPIAKEVLEARVKGSKDYKLSHGQVCKALLSQQTEKKHEEAKRLLSIAWEESVECDDWKLQIGDELSSILVASDIDKAILVQKQVLAERKKRHANQSGIPADMVNSGFHLAKILEKSGEQCRTGTEKSYRDEQRQEIFQDLWAFWNVRLPGEVVGDLLTAGYEVGHRYCLKQEWNKAESVLTDVSGGMRSGHSYIEQPFKIQVLRALASVYRDGGVKNNTSAESVLGELYQELKSSPDFGPGNEETLRCGYQLSRLIEAQPGRRRTLEAAIVMKTVFDVREEALSNGRPVTRELLDTALSYGRLLWKLAQDTKTGQTVLGDRSMLFHLAQHAFGIVWNKRADNAKLDKALDNAQILEASRNLATCFVELHNCACADALNQGNEIWTFKQRQDLVRSQETLDFGYHLGTCLKDLGNVGTDEVAVGILQDIWTPRHQGKSSANRNVRRDLRYGNALGVCLLRLGRYKEAGRVLEEVWKEHEQLRAGATNATSDYAYNYGCCLLELGDYSKAHGVLTKAKFPLGDAREKPLQHALEKAQKALDMTKDRDVALSNYTAEQKRAQDLEKDRDEIKKKYKGVKKELQKKPGFFGRK